MIEIKFLCPHCGTKILVDEGVFGLQVNCPNCGKAMMAPVGRQVPEQKPPACLKVEMPADLDALEKKSHELQKSIDEKQQQAAQAERRLRDMESRFTDAANAVKQTEERLRRVEGEVAAKQRQAVQCDTDAELARARAHNTLKDLEAKERQLCAVIDERNRQAEEAEARLRTSRDALGQNEERLRRATNEYEARQRQLADWETTLRNSKAHVLDSVNALECREAQLKALVDSEQQQAAELQKVLHDTEARIHSAQEAFSQSQERLRLATVDLESKQRQVLDCEGSLNNTKARTLDALRDLEEKEGTLQALTQSIAEKQRQESGLTATLEERSLQASEAALKLSQTVSALNTANDRLRASELQYFETFIKPHLPAELLHHFSRYEQGFQSMFAPQDSPGPSAASRDNAADHTPVTAPPAAPVSVPAAPTAEPRVSVPQQAAPSAMICPCCKEQIEAAWKFCKFCGEPLEASAVPASPPAFNAATSSAAPEPGRVAPTQHTAPRPRSPAPMTNHAPAMMTCPFCKEQIEAEALTCRFCLEPLAANAVDRAARTASYPSKSPVRSAH